MTERTATGRAARGALLLCAAAALLLGQFFCSQPARAATRAPDPRCYSADNPPTGSLGKITTAAPAGVYLWLDAASWHIRVTDPQPSASFTGEIAGCSPVQVASYLTTTADQVLVSPNTDSLHFTLTPATQLDGFEFNAVCPTTWTFSFQLDGAPVPPDEITVGRAGVHPAASTFALPACPESGIAPFGVRSRSLDAADAGSLSETGLFTVPALTLAQVTSTWPQLELPARSRPLFGDPAAATPLAADVGNNHSVLAAVGLAGEIGLGVLVVAVWFMARRQRKAEL